VAETAIDEVQPDLEESTLALEPDEPEEKQWYIVNTYSAQENKVRASIERHVEARHLGDKFGRILVPEEEEVILRGGVRRTIKKKVFPGYVFVEMVMDDETWHIIRGMPGVLGFVSSGNVPQALLPSDVERLLGGVAAKPEPVAPQWSRCDIVRVVDGPFAESTGRIEEVDGAHKKLTVLIEIFGRDTPVSLEFNHVEKI
jgi:transcription termination/antitermination protein NusG